MLFVPQQRLLQETAATALAGTGDNTPDYDGGDAGDHLNSIVPPTAHNPTVNFSHPSFNLVSERQGYRISTIPAGGMKYLQTTLNVCDHSYFYF